jgi:hypothetical protein
MFRRNVGGLDRAVRVVLGGILLPVGLFLWHLGYGPLMAILGLILLATGILGFCPPYLLFHFSTAHPEGETAATGSPSGR